MQRALAELRRGGAVILRDGPLAAHVAAIETLDEWTLAGLQAAASGGKLALLVTAERAQHLGFAPVRPGEPCALALAPDLGPETLRQIADPTGIEPDLAALDLAPIADLSPALSEAAIELAKAARLLPAVLFVPVAGESLAEDSAFRLEARDLTPSLRAAAAQLRRVGSARLPLEGAEEAEIVAFRPADGGKEHLAILIGRPDPESPVLLRLHSECLTGDLLGSLRCDCGQQLRGAIQAIAKAGSGILIYLAQEGRGIGLVNKLRAYRLQDRGIDTLEANLQLGFGADERLYRPAAEILRQLGIGNVRLLTNNPEKVKGLAQCGIRVVERVPHVFPSNDHNRRYLKTKAVRFGHMF